MNQVNSQIKRRNRQVCVGMEWASPASPQPIGLSVDFGRMERLAAEAKELIVGWATRARTAQVSREPTLHDRGRAFEGFIFLWIAFNAWGACVTDQDSDSVILRLLAADGKLRKRFEEMLSYEEDVTFRRAVERFVRLHPIFETKRLRERSIAFDARVPTSRRDRVRFYREHGVDDFEPLCWDEGHWPGDWPHVLWAAYRVRNNLFHGEKSVGSEADAEIVDAAFQTLFLFLTAGESPLIELRGAHRT